MELLVVGNELLNGTTLDTNSHWLSMQLTNAGATVLRKTTVKDDLQLISSAFTEAIQRKPDWIFSIGGLGPTFDDMTLKGLALAVHRKIERSKEAVRLIHEFRTNAGKSRKIAGRLTKSTLKMAELPKGSKPLRNTQGTAPGVLTLFAKTKIVSLPGVPREMKAIFSQEVEPMLRREISGYGRREIWLRVKGLGESRIAPLVARLQKTNEPAIYIKSHAIGFQEGVSLLKIQVTATYSEENEHEAIRKLKAVTGKLKSSLRRMEGKVEEVKSRR
jgi:molybdenum cofactor synthesis domain-containing protein